MTGRFDYVADKMAGQERLNDRDSDCASSSNPEKNVKLQLSIKMFEQWQGQYAA